MEVKRYCVYGDWVYGKDSFGPVDKCPGHLHPEEPHYVYASEFDRILAERDALRDQLAEAHALLTELEDCPWVVDEVTIPKAGIEAAPHQVVGTMHVGLMRLRKVRAWLSASAEPIPFPGYPPVPEDRKLPAESSAPVERDERADFEADWAHRMKVAGHRERANAFYRIQPTDRYRWNDVQDAWDAWQARAALELKP